MTPQSNEFHEDSKLNGPDKESLRILAFAPLPFSFIAILFVWHQLDLFLGQREVASYIIAKQQWIENERRNPKVHSISLSHVPEHPERLLIQFDVEDARTYLRLEDEIWPTTTRFPPSWDTNLRSKEDLGNNWGIAAEGIGEVVKGFVRLFCAAIGSLVVFCIALSIYFRARSKRLSKLLNRRHETQT